MMVAETKQYIMPKPPRGAPVVWFVHGRKSDSPEVGFVIKVGASSVTVQLASGICREAVRHIDDPRLEMNEFQRENGAWDFTEETRALVDIRARVAELEAEVQALKSGRVGKGKAVTDPN